MKGYVCKKCARYTEYDEGICKYCGANEDGELSFCSNCHCMTNSIKKGRAKWICGKCKSDKSMSHISLEERKGGKEE